MPEWRQRNADDNLYPTDGNAATAMSELNWGMLRIGPNASATGPDAGQRTIIITGLGRSGTTMMATMLRSANLYIGTKIYEATQEDAEFVHILTQDELENLPALIKSRNNQFPTWGFKLPALHAFLPSSSLGLFRNPHLIVIFRDPIAIAVRHALAEKVDAHGLLLDGIDGSRLLMEYALNAQCPALLVSYEKMLAAPDKTIDTILDFCGLSADADRRTNMLAAVQPNNSQYIVSATRHFSGRIDGVVNHRLSGWCWEVGNSVPVRVDLIVNDHVIGTVMADRFRHDLRKQGIGDGRHGFQIDLAQYTIAADAIIRVRVHGRTAELRGGDQTLQSLRR